MIKIDNRQNQYVAILLCSLMITGFAQFRLGILVQYFTISLGIVLIPLFYVVIEGFPILPVSVLSGILVAVGIVCSPLSIPVGASKCAPVQHFINILGGVFLGPAYAVGMAFVTSLLRNLLGTGTLLAFPGSMCGAFLCGMLYKYGKHLPFAYLGELFGTSVIGGLLSWPIAAWLMGSESAVYGFILPFFVSSCGGTILAVVLVTAMKRMRVFDVYLGNLEPRSEQHARS